ncbi:d17da73b-b793-4efe-a376-d11816c436f8 [Sclerotinia trifoliorum]|uniref:D17da73b-b793-4efe-a376-d11816c436f8 n=1 Tax=Sclerotinia trifoliorum TaxID=28548 RepID=A0A8H2VY26_9HELO|nr:d17da73b-b793-4efe-a376-d11816c436f8 [Sclerotinia trifoliorum]
MQLGIGGALLVKNIQEILRVPMQDRRLQAPLVHGLSGVPVRDQMNRSGSSLRISGTTFVGDAKEAYVVVGDINMSFPMGFKGSFSLSSNSSSASTSTSTLTSTLPSTVSTVYHQFKSLSSLSRNTNIYSESNMLLVESIIVLATACMLYILSFRRKTHTHRVQPPNHQKTSSTSRSATNTTKFLYNPLPNISRLLSCTSPTSSTSPTPSPTSKTSPSTPTPNTQKQSKPEPAPQEPPYILPPLKPSSPHPTSMGLKRLDQSNWLTIDSFYQTEHTLRASLLETHGPCVLQVLKPAVSATYEVLEMAVEFLLKRYPDDFSLVSSEKLLNKLTGEEHIIGSSCPNPLETAARICMEDFNILLQDPEDGVDAEWNLMASATLFPAGWKLQERIGSSMAVLHAPVPGWKEKLGKSVNRYFTHLTPRTCMERSNLFIQTTPILFQDAPEPPRSPTHPLTASDIYVRRERQTFTRLPKSGAVLFTVRTYMEGLTELGFQEAESLAKQVRGWEREMGRYKGWGGGGGVGVV